MRRILCFGDSNTWGYDPTTGSRYAPDDRWPGALRVYLGADFEVIEEGLNARTTVLDDPKGDYRNGKHYLIPCLASHTPLDLVIIMLGTNDLKARFKQSAASVGEGVKTLIAIVRTNCCASDGNAPVVLLIAPPPLGKLRELADDFVGGQAKSHLLSRYYRQVAVATKCGFLDAGDLVITSALDGIHLDAGEHRKLAQAIATWVQRAFPLER